MSAENHLTDIDFPNDLVDSTQLDFSDGQFYFQQFNSEEAEVPQTTGGGKAAVPSDVKAKQDIAACTDDYLNRRNRNNLAVKKSRQKSKQKGATTAENIERLKVENVELEEKVEVLNKELSVLKKIFMDHAKGFSGVGGEADLPDLEQLEKLLGHKLTNKKAAAEKNGDGPSTSIP